MDQHPWDASEELARPTHPNIQGTPGRWGAGDEAHEEICSTTSRPSVAAEDGPPCPSEVSASRHAGGVLLSEVQPERLQWLSRGRLPQGKLTDLVGDPGLGKSTLALAWAAAISRGQALLNGDPGPPRGVVILASEDGLADTIRPRLEAAGAD
ncbi:MAG: AAA family ATPase, partial [Chloroflexota bacterium]|nr:AAA family ATPase [Chloroflexota bacterium]